MLNNKDIKLINRLGKLLIKRNTSIFRVYIMSCIYTKRKSVVYGYNSVKSHPLMKKYGRHPDAIFIHSEIDTIKEAAKKGFTENDFARSTLISIRIKHVSTHNKKFIYGLAKPCSGCRKAIEAFNIGRVIYSTDNNKFEEIERTK